MSQATTHFDSSCDFLRVNTIPCELLIEENTNLICGNIHCEICKSDDPILMLTCGKCGLIVHNYCYEFDNFHDPWICQSCLCLSLYDETIVCEVCSGNRGALRKYSKGWRHIICNKWEIFQENNLHQCEKCNIQDKNSIQCSDCRKFYHPYCGFENGMKIIDGKPKCGKHFMQEPKKEGKKDLRKEPKKIIIREELPSREIQIPEEISVEAPTITQKVSENTVKKQKTSENTVKKHKNSDNTVKKQKTSENTVKIRINPVEDSLGDNTVPKYRFNPEIQSLTKIKKIGTKLELSRLLENYFFANSEIQLRSYKLRPQIQESFNKSEFLYTEFPEVVLNFLTSVL